jgi:hypothetical protein
MPKQTALEIAREHRRHTIAAGYRERHPARAAEEAALRRERAELLREGAADYLGTPETRWRVRKAEQGALARLYERGYISLDQLSWSQSILVVHERIGRDVAVASMSRVDGGRCASATFFEKLGAVRAEVTYTRWRGQARGLGPVLALICGEGSLSEVARLHRMRPATLRRVLGDALDLWGDLNGRVCDEIDEAALLAAQAGILG